MSARRTTIRAHSGAPRFAAVVATLLAIATLVPAKAEAAGCGRHVAPSADSIALLGRLRSVLGYAAELGPLPPRPTPPCSGPECTEGRRPESPTPSSVLPTSLREWGSLTDIPVLTPQATFAVQTAEPILRALDIPFRPERPPRPFA